MSKTIAEAASRFLSRRTKRRGFLTQSAMVGSALTVAPKKFIMEPGTAYSALITCNGFTCQPGNLCCDGYTEFCCTLYGTNGCPPGSLYGGWWKVTGSSYCGGTNRYYMDCHSQCGGCGCGAGGVCSGSCNGTICGCGAGSCFNRKAGCTHFRYGQCNTAIPCVGPIICRVVTCTPPWELEPSCTTSMRFDEATRWHHRPCLEVQNSPHLPQGSIDKITANAEGFRVMGWALDPDELGAIEVAVYRNGTEVARVTAAKARFDVGQAHVEHGPNHGFDIYVPSPVGTHRVCVYAINVGEGGRNPLIDCGDVVIDPLNDPLDNQDEPAESNERVQLPTGSVDSFTASTGQVEISGWAENASQPGAVPVAVTIDGEVMANGITDASGSFTLNVPVPSGSHRMCVYAANSEGRTTALFGCEDVVVP